MPENKDWENTDWTTVYFNRREKYFLVMVEARKGYGRVEIGEFAKIPDSEFEKAVAQVVSKSLDSFQSNSPNSTFRMSPEEYKTFRKQHLGVGVQRRRPSGELTIMPLHRRQGGFVGTRTEQILLSGNEYAAKVASSLREAFNIAT